MTIARELLNKYIQSTEQVFGEIRLATDRLYVDEEKTKDIIAEAKRYFEDARFFLARKQFETGLVSIAYSEGLLDALRLLGKAEFQWPRAHGCTGDKRGITHCMSQK